MLHTGQLILVQKPACALTSTVYFHASLLSVSFRLRTFRLGFSYGNGMALRWVCTEPAEIELRVHSR